MPAHLKYVVDGQSMSHAIVGTVLIGRGRECHIKLADALSSKRHAEVRYTPGGYILDDLGSSNGTLLNGKVVKRAHLKPGDAVTIGSVTLILEITSDSAPRSAIVFDQDDDDSSIILDEVEARTKGEIRWDFERDTEQSSREGIKALRQRLGILQELCELTATVDDPEELTRRSIEALMSAFPQLNRCCLLDCDEECAAFEVKHQEIRDMEPPGRPSRAVCSRAAKENRCILSKNVAADPRFDYSQSLQQIGTKSVMCAPLKGRDRILGLLYLETIRDDSAFTPDDLQLLATVAADISLGLDNARLRSERLQMERLAAIGEAIAGMAHCVKNVLNTINCGAYIIDSGISKQDWDTVQKGWGLMGNSNNFLKKMVLDMLAYSKPREPSYEDIDINAFCRDVCDSCNQLAEKNGVTLRYEPSGDVKAMIDAVAMQRALYNLVSNAIEACKSGGEVKLILDPDKDIFRIIVADTGCGMTSEVKKKLFQTFFSTKGSRGTGLGLPCVGKTVSEHQGRIEVESQVGVGTKFILTIPYHPAEK
ncbi:MAG TPA: ATP-binding protein [Candidatus Brocadiia bacterium]|nr:ATP-binding protein [Candidatus Brocadiia bacterium]